MPRPSPAAGDARRPGQSSTTKSRKLARWAHYGHSAAEYAVALGDAAGARHVALFHHSPGRTDDELDALVDRIGRPDVSAATEGDVWVLPATSSP